MNPSSSRTVHPETLIRWLRDAWAMERGMERSLRSRLETGVLPAAMRAEAERHLAETEGHTAAVKRCLDSLHAEPPVVEAAGFPGAAADAASGAGADDPVKLALAFCAAEHFEIACYRALRTVALELGLTDIAGVCDRILDDELRMAAWLEESIPPLATGRLHPRRPVPA